jgi:glycosyltransferase involved in cell wall biosynthesis
MELSIVTTIYNDADIVPLLVQRVKAAVEPMQIPYEIVLVNDCSPDQSEAAIQKQCELYPEVKGVSLSRNYGQQIAMSAGMRHAKGNFVIIMDGDLQNPPEKIPALYAKIKEGYDLVYTTGTVRNGWRDELSSRIFWWVLAKLFSVKVVPYQLMMKIMNKDFLRRFNSYNEQSRTIAGIVNDIGLKYTTIPILNEKRLSGKSNYNFFKRFNLMIDVIISFSNAPLNIMIHFGWIIFALTTIMAFYQLFLYLTDSIPQGYTSTILSIFFFGSLIILMLGFIGRYLANIYAEVKNRPLYDVQKTYNL